VLVVAAAICILVYIVVRGNRILRMIVKCPFVEIALHVGTAAEEEHETAKDNLKAGSKSECKPKIKLHARNTAATTRSGYCDPPAHDGAAQCHAAAVNACLPRITSTTGPFASRTRSCGGQGGLVRGPRSRSAVQGREIGGVVGWLERRIA